MQNALTLAAFIPILNAMGDFNPSVLGGPDMVIPNFMTWAAFGWSATAALAMGAIAYTLPKLTRKTQHANGDFRAGLISVQSQPEQIALAQGEKFEKGLLKKIHRRAVNLDVKMINKNMQMMVFNSIEGNVGNYVPYLFTVPLGMGAMLTFGTAMQAAGIFRTVDRSVDFVKRTIPQFAIVKANVDRIAQLIDGIELSKYEMLEKEYYRRLEDGETTPSGDTGHQPTGPAL
jgi:putative ATP-binding cassette transporter